MTETAPPASAVLRVLDTGLGASVQDRGRIGWRRFGVPPSGWIDSHAAECANRLLENPSSAPVIELLLQGAAFEVLHQSWFAICGASVHGSLPAWRAHLAQPGEILRFSHCRSGVWSYLAVEGGFDWPMFFGSASYYARGKFGQSIEKGALLHRIPRPHLKLPDGVSGRVATWRDQRDYTSPPPIRIWRGPQWASLSKEDRQRLVSLKWQITSQSDRVGYRLAGAKLRPDPPEIYSEPVRVGSIQVPQNGEPIVIMPDGPTVGGYPKIALVDPDSLPWLAQSRPGQKVSFELLDEN